MKNKIIFRLLPLIALAITLQSCRTNEDYLSAKEESYYSNKFQVFTPINNQPVDYFRGFRALLESYDHINHTTYTRAALLQTGNFGKNDAEYVELNLHSQEILLDDGERWVIYPMIKNKQVSGLMAGILTNKETEVEFRKLDSNSSYYTEVSDIFRVAYLKSNLKLGLQSKGSGCGYDGLDECNIEGVEIPSPPRPRPSGGGPKGGCNGFDNCFSNPGGGDVPGGGGPGNSGGITLTMPPPPKIAIADMKKFLSCLNINQSANLKVFAESMGNGHGVGHAFISITQGNNTMTFGFYPKYGLTQSVTGQGIFGDDSGHVYTNVLNAGTITPTQLQQIIATALAYSNSMYSLGFSNCSDFALSVLNLVGVTNNTAGVDTPDTVAGLIGSASNGTAPQTQRNCN